MFKWSVWILALVLTGCPSSPQPQPAADAGAADATQCPDDWPATCPDPTLKWTGQVDAIVLAKCATCHNPEGKNPDLNFRDNAYDLVKALSKSSIRMQVSSCRMPAAGGAPLTATERAQLQGWIVCGTPK